jgi:hypothetical protein
MLTEPAAAFVTGCLPGVRTIPGQTTVHEALMTSCRASPRINNGQDFGNQVLPPGNEFSQRVSRVIRGCPS